MLKFNVFVFEKNIFEIGFLCKTFIKENKINFGVTPLTINPTNDFICTFHYANSETKEVIATDVEISSTELKWLQELKLGERC